MPGARQIQFWDGDFDPRPVAYPRVSWPPGGPSGMKNFLRLLRYGLPYVLQILPGVLLLAMVGALDTFRTLLFQPILNNVLDPKAPDGPITLGLPKTQWHFDLRIAVPHFMHNAWTVVAFAL